jgi:hypothetical protein
MMVVEERRPLMTAREGETMANLMNEQRKHAADLVERARLYDQNAIAMIEEVRKAANMGSAKAVSALQCICEYIKKNPVSHESSQAAQECLGRLKFYQNPPHIHLKALQLLPVVGEPADIGTACVILSRGPMLDKQRVSEIAECIGTEEGLQTFNQAYKAAGKSEILGPMSRYLDQHGIGFLCAGHCIGTGRKLQLTQSEDVPLSILGPEIGWEHG